MQLNWNCSQCVRSPIEGCCVSGLQGQFHQLRWFRSSKACGRCQSAGAGLVRFHDDVGRAGTRRYRGINIPRTARLQVN